RLPRTSPKAVSSSWGELKKGKFTHVLTCGLRRLPRVNLKFTLSLCLASSHNEQSFFTHRPLTGFSGVNAGRNGINHLALTVLGNFLGLASAVWNQAEPRCFTFLVCRAGSQTGASELGGSDSPRHDEFPLCRIHLAQSNTSMCRHDRWGIRWNL